MRYTDRNPDRYKETERRTNRDKEIQRERERKRERNCKILNIFQKHVKNGRTWGKRDSRETQTEIETQTETQR